MGFSQEIITEIDNIWQANLKHPFVQEIGAGTLPVKKFKYYMVQDYVYLMDYAKVFALGALKSPDLKTMIQFSNTLQSILTEEMSLHRQYAAQFNISEETLASAEPAPTTLAYKNYLLSVAQTGGQAELLAVLLPCMWGYETIGKNLAHSPGAKNVLYGEWIAMYSSPDFSALTEWLIQEFDRITAQQTLTQRVRLINIFKNSLRYEVLFWEMAYQEEKWLV
ncbi:MULTISPECIES: thiaminase II [Leuconostoc]|uniref:Aminopyrimidine aminohydrolase n=2 Tax=Leuconostoc kimchii TaxID=136609 RepID=D5T080_LEUKI|nr:MULTISPECIES: thiaminase II [Leuconostoc]ADG39679.1 transcriptional activator of extracellular enzyme genes [Leuconostoc kimchii IMSNU 11154]AEJ30460.1 transcriptional activator of extracellular enzyme genes [Leuconostoc sp. C2]QBR47520.1 thiaminase II [Leuconostoc kimchii]